MEIVLPVNRHVTNHLDVKIINVQVDVIQV